jgi:hypothetical protein
MRCLELGHQHAVPDPLAGFRVDRRGHRAAVVKVVLLVRRADLVPQVVVLSVPREPATQQRRLQRFGRCRAARDQLGLDPVGIRVPALPQEQFGLPLGHHVPGPETDRRQAPPLPHAGRDTGFVLGGAQRRTRSAAAVADHHAAEEIAPPVPRANLRFADHRPMEPRR